MFCQKCGAQVQESDKFCMFCGVRLAINPPSTETSTLRSNSDDTVQKQNNVSGADDSKTTDGYNKANNNYTETNGNYNQNHTYRNNPFSNYPDNNPNYIPPNNYNPYSNMYRQQGFSSGKGIASLVLGIISLVFCVYGWIVGIIGLILGISSLNDCKRYNETYRANATSGNAVAGIVLSIIGIAVWGLVFLVRGLL